MVFNDGLDCLFDHRKICFDRGRWGLFPHRTGLSGSRRQDGRSLPLALVCQCSESFVFGLPGNADRKNLPVLTVTSPHEMSWEKMECLLY